jgi:hypothetical protein
MERGPVALFGAIVAVGLGPAMWLGAQFGNAIETPAPPPAVRSEQHPNQQLQDRGGSAGSAPENPTVVLDTKPRANVKPLGKPSASPTSQTPSDDPSTEPSASPSPTPTADPTTPSTDPTDATDPPGGGNGGGTLPPSPPSGSGSGDGGSGSGGSGSGGSGSGGSGNGDYSSFIA